MHTIFISAENYNLKYNCCVDVNEKRDPKKKITVEDVIDKINEKLEKKAVKKKKKIQRKGTSGDLVKAQQNIFMGEDMNASVPFQDCIEVQFGEYGNIECFKLRKNLTRLAAEKNEENVVDIIKNFEYSIDQLNKALFLNEKKEFTTGVTQTENEKPILLSFLKQLLSHFESFDGGEEERVQIENGLKHYSEYELLNTEVTRITDNDNKLMTFRELMFSLFEYAKEKAISINYHRKETGLDLKNDIMFPDNK